MASSDLSRRTFLGASAALAAGGGVPYFFTSDAEARLQPRSKNDRLRIGAIGMRYQGTVIAKKAVAHGDVVAICDVDRTIAEKAKKDFGGRATLYGDYRKMFARKDIDVVTIGTPDHWHTAMIIAAARAGKDIYCEKPLTLTIDEGKLLCKVIKETGCVLQVGSWQRSDSRFRLACEMVRQGRIGKLRTVDVVLGKNKTGGPFQTKKPPADFNWDMWQGQTPHVAYIKERSHYTFRWWYEYSGGQMTDWGAHNLDIAQWGIGQPGPIRIEAKAAYPDVKNGYNVATSFEAKYHYPGDVVMTVKDTGRNGVMFTGTTGRIFVNRGTVSGKPVEELKEKPLPREEFRLYASDNLDRPPRAGKLESIINHMGNFFDCVKSRKMPVSDVVSQHQSVSVCHLGNIAMRLDRPLRWDSKSEIFIDDKDANAMLKRPQRKGYEITGKG